MENHQGMEMDLRGPHQCSGDACASSDSGLAYENRQVVGSALRASCRLTSGAGGGHKGANK